MFIYSLAWVQRTQTNQLKVQRTSGTYPEDSQDDLTKTMK